MSHTPGPWEVVDCLEAGLVDERANVAMLGKYRIVCNAKHGSLGEDGDAHLIAAAPDLLKAAKHVLAILDHPKRGVSILDADKLRDAIEKARGKLPQRERNG